jgi:putative flippase GtrA
MNTKRWISLGIAVLVIVLAIVLTNVLPIWITFYACLAFVAGFVAGYLFKKPEVITKTIEKIVEVAKPIKVKKAKKVE